MYGWMRIAPFAYSLCQGSSDRKRRLCGNTTNGASITGSITFDALGTGAGMKEIGGCLRRCCFNSDDMAFGRTAIIVPSFKTSIYSAGSSVEIATH